MAKKAKILDNKQLTRKVEELEARIKKLEELL